MYLYILRIFIARVLRVAQYKPVIRRSFAAVLIKSRDFRHFGAFCPNRAASVHGQLTHIFPASVIGAPDFVRISAPARNAPSARYFRAAAERAVIYAAAVRAAVARGELKRSVGAVYAVVQKDVYIGGHIRVDFANPPHRALYRPVGIIPRAAAAVIARRRHVYFIAPRRRKLRLSDRFLRTVRLVPHKNFHAVALLHSAKLDIKPCRAAGRNRPTVAFQPAKAAVRVDRSEGSDTFARVRVVRHLRRNSEQVIIQCPAAVLSVFAYDSYIRRGQPRGIFDRQGRGFCRLKPPHRGQSRRDNHAAAVPRAELIGLERICIRVLFPYRHVDISAVGQIPDAYFSRFLHRQLIIKSDIYRAPVKFGADRRKRGLINAQRAELGQAALLIVLIYHIPVPPAACRTVNPVPPLLRRARLAARHPHIVGVILQRGA